MALYLRKRYKHCVRGVCASRRHCVFNVYCSNQFFRKRETLRSHPPLSHSSSVHSLMWLTCGMMGPTTWFWHEYMEAGM